ncbi:plastid division protein PDV2 [Phalaenopsis equestris]|uniref:plastid division protein PDV2 n=1 Tax=Phalaenopsis equestris TaxID=78828 RepID=UPI0009E1D622|nr:plastid division protein PDV2 [Phalaenopsis equestris]
MVGDEKIGLMLSRASRLRLKITDAIDRSGDNEIGRECDEEGILVGIREALESLEKQLASLQDLQQRQRYEREVVLTQIDHSRKTLFIKLEEYKGDDLEVIHEAAAFAAEAVAQDDVFFLPSSSYFDSKNNPSKSDFTVDPTPENNRDNESYMELTAQPASHNKQKWMASVLGFIARSAICFVGLVSVLSLTGFRPEIRKRDTSNDLFELLSKTAGEVRDVSIHCPPGKALVIEDGKASCLVKERVEIPFGSDFENLNINIAFG